MFLRAAAFRADAFAARFLGGEAGGVIPPDPEPEARARKLTYGMGISAKSAVHPHPRFNAKH